MTDIEKIKAEIERRIGHIEVSDIRFPSMTDVEVVLRQLLSFIDTLEQEPSLPSDVDEAAEEYAANRYTNSFDQRICIKEFKAGAEWMKSQIK